MQRGQKELYELHGVVLTERWSLDEGNHQSHQSPGIARQAYHVCLQGELPATVLGQVELPEDLEGPLSHQGHYAWGGGGLCGPVSHGQHTHTQVNTFQVRLQTRIIVNLCFQCSVRSVATMVTIM